MADRVSGFSDEEQAEAEVEARLYLRPGRVEVAEVDDEIVAVDLGEGVYFSVNQPGTLLWRALLHGTTERALIAALVQRYQIDSERASQDTAVFLAQLRERELLEVRG